MKRMLFALAVAALLGAGVAAQAPDRLGRIDRLFQQFVDDNRIGGAVVLVLRDGKPVYDKAFGWADKEAGRKMTTDTIFRIASQIESDHQRRHHVAGRRGQGRDQRSGRAGSSPVSRRRRSRWPAKATSRSSRRAGRSPCGIC